MEEWELLEKNADQRLLASNLLFENQSFQGFGVIVELSFMALELSFKAAIKREDPKIQQGIRNHDLPKIVQLSDSLILSELKKNKPAYKLYIELVSGSLKMWIPDDRYIGAFTQEDAELYLKNCKRLIPWVKKNFLKK